MKVKIIEEDSIYSLQEKINAFLLNREDTIVDIKYSGNGNIVLYGDSRYSAMIITR